MQTDGPAWYENKVTLWILGLLLAAMATAGGFMFNRVKTLKVESRVLVQERDQLVQLSRMAEARIHQAETRSTTTESKYRRLLLATNPITGEPLFDKQGNPIFNTDEGSAEAVETLQATLEQTMLERAQLQKSLSEREQELSLLKKQTSRPARGPWDFGLGYSAPVKEWLSLPVATWWTGAGYHLELMGLDVGVNAQAGLCPGIMDRLGETAQGKVFLSVRP